MEELNKPISSESLRLWTSERELNYCWLNCQRDWTYTTWKGQYGSYTMSQDGDIVTIIKIMSDKVDRLSEALTNRWKDENDRRWERCW